VSGDSADRPWTLLTGFAAENVPGLVRDVTVLITCGPAALTALSPAAFLGLYIIGATFPSAIGAPHTTQCQVLHPQRLPKFILGKSFGSSLLELLPFTLCHLAS